jgi:hypothetical protein
MKPNLAEKSEFFMLFDKHWEAGSGRPPQRDVRYDYWIPSEFLNRLGKCGCVITDDTLANWRNGKALPREPAFKAILRVFFPSDSMQGQSQGKTDTDREQMRLAYEIAKDERRRKPRAPESWRASKTQAAPDPIAPDVRAMVAMQPDPNRSNRSHEPNDPRSNEECDRQEDERKLRRLKSIVADLLSKSMAAMDALSSQMSRDEASPRGVADRATMLIERLMEANFEQSRRWLHQAHRDLYERSAIEVIEEVSQYILPWLLILDPNFRGNGPVPPSVGAFIPIRAGVETMAVIVLAGIAKQRATFTSKIQTKAGPNYPVAPYTLTDVPPSGPYDVIIPHLRKELLSRLGLEVAYEKATQEAIDKGINGALEFAAEEQNIHWHYILEVPDSESEFSALQAAWANAVKLYPRLVVVEMDRRLIGHHDPFLNSLRRLFGLL